MPNAANAGTPPAGTPRRRAQRPQQACGILMGRLLGDSQGDGGAAKYCNGGEIRDRVIGRGAWLQRGHRAMRGWGAEQQRVTIGGLAPDMIAADGAASAGAILDNDARIRRQFWSHAFGHQARQQIR